MKNSSTLKWLQSYRIAVLKGGWSSERPISLLTGQAVEAAFKRLRVKFFPIDVKKNIADVLVRKKIQFVFNALHGPFGEDGQIQYLCDLLGIGYTGSNSISSFIAMNKDLSKEMFCQNGVLTPPWIVIRSLGEKNKVAKFLSHGSVFIKPTNQGSALGATHVKKVGDIERALKKCFRISDAALVEQKISGRELTVGILGERALPVTEIIPQHGFYDFHSKYSQGGSRHITPAHLSPAQIRQAQMMALRAFKSLSCSVYGRVDIIMNKRGQMYVLEVNTIPGMTSTSLLPEAAKAAGIDFNALVLEIASGSRR